MILLIEHVMLWFHTWAWFHTNIRCSPKKREIHDQSLRLNGRSLTKNYVTGPANRVKTFGVQTFYPFQFGSVAGSLDGAALFGGGGICGVVRQRGAIPARPGVYSRSGGGRSLLGGNSHEVGGGGPCGVDSGIGCRLGFHGSIISGVSCGYHRLKRESCECFQNSDGDETEAQLCANGSKFKITRMPFPMRLGEREISKSLPGMWAWILVREEFSVLGQPARRNNLETTWPGSPGCLQNRICIAMFVHFVLFLFPLECGKSMALFGRQRRIQLLHEVSPWFVSVVTLRGAIE